MSRRIRSARGLGVALTAVLLLLVLLSLHTGPTGRIELGSVVRGVLAVLGLAERPEGTLQTILELRLWRTLVAVGVGAALAYSGALLQGLFRNGLASPSVLGVTSGASLGASLAILLVGGYGPDLVQEHALGVAPLLVTLFGFIGAFAVAVLVTLLATAGGRVSVPTLLLVGIAINLCIGGVLAGIQSLALRDSYEVAQAIFAWSFGNLTDRSSGQAGLIWGGLACAALAIPFVASELDLFAGGEKDAEALGVATVRVKWLVLAAAALAASSAVAVAGQIAFVGLVVPHILRLTSGASHRHLLVLSLLGGAVFLLGADLTQRALLGRAALQPGVVMSLLGGPFFLVLLVRSGREVRTW